MNQILEDKSMMEPGMLAVVKKQRIQDFFFHKVTLLFSVMVLVALAEKMGLKIRDLLFPVFVAIAGTSVSVSVIDSMAILGLDLTRARLRHAMGTLGGISGKQQKNLEKEYQQLGL